MIKFIVNKNLNLLPLHTHDDQDGLAKYHTNEYNKEVDE